MRAIASVGGCVALAAACAVAVSRAGPAAPPPRTLDIHVDARGGGDDLGIRLEVRGLEPGRQTWLKQLDDGDVIAYSDLVVETPDGTPLPVVQDGVRFMVGELPGDGLVARYRARPGGIARHGHQGLVTPEWAGFDGRVVLQPREIQRFDAVRWHFEVPDGWTVASSLVPETDGAWTMPPMAGNDRAAVLKSMCVGLGPFRADTRTLGGTEVRVFTWSGWEDGAVLAANAHRVVGWFHQTLGFDPKRPFAVVWTPPAPDGGPVWSGAGASGACYERPGDGWHGWELLGHRIAHPMNTYAPDGLLYAGRGSRWFLEGFASYTEREALIGSGMAADAGLYNALYRRHRQVMAEHPAWARLPLVDEPDLQGDVLEDLHYQRSPLVVKMLADAVRRRSSTTLEAFMKHAFETHGGFRGALDLPGELEQFTGARFGDFWAAMIEAPGPVVPVWPEYAEVVGDARPEAVIAAGPIGWSEAQLLWLLRSGRYSSAAALADDLRETGRKHAELARRGADLLPPEVGALRLALPPDVRADVDALERAWPLEGGPPAPSWGCAGSRPLSRPVLEATGAAGHGFLALVEAEAGARIGGGGGLDQLRFGVGEDRVPWPGSVLAVRRDEPLRGLLTWASPPATVGVAVYQGGDSVYSRVNEVHSDWRTSWVGLGPDRLGDHTGVLDVAVFVDGKRVAHRPILRLPDED